MIPRLLHHIWLGPRPVPDAWAAEWARLHPGWEQRIWREADLAKLKMRLRAKYTAQLEAGCWHGAADIARLEVLRRHGGVYIDIDSRPLRTFEGADFMEASVFAGYEPVPSLPGRVANGTIGAERGAPAIATCLDLIGGMEVLDPPWDTTGGTSLTAALLVHRRCCDVRVMPPRTFYSTDARGHRVAGTEKSYSEHYWASTNRGYSARAVVMVPWRGGDPQREAAWDFVRTAWKRDGWAVVTGEPKGKTWSASEARNAAASAATDWDVAVFADADTIPGDFDVIRKAVEVAHKRDRMVRPYRHYWQMDEAATATWLKTGERPSEGASHLREVAHGGVNVIPRGLFEKVGGYDERFKGWGWEDTAMEAACRVLGGFEQLTGDVYHLWHPIGPDRAADDPQRLANVALGHRYLKARTRRAMRDIVAEREPKGEPRFGLVIIANGRRDHIEQTVSSIDEHLGDFDARLICDDSGDPEYAAWLRETFPGFTIDAHRHLGHGGAVHTALQRAASLPVDWVFWCEDDMTFTRKVDLHAMAAQMDANPLLAQMVIKRQAWFPAEVEAGPTVIDRFDAAEFTERGDGNGSAWLEHRLFYSLNPHLVRRSFIAHHRWPARPNSEHHFSRRLFRERGLVVGMWGKRTDAPWVLHMGGERTGTGY